MQNETKNQDLDFQRSITFLMPKRKELVKTQTAFLFTASSNYWHSLANLMSFVDVDFIFDMLLYKLKSLSNIEHRTSNNEQRKTNNEYWSQSQSECQWFIVHRFSNNGKRTTNNEQRRTLPVLRIQKKSLIIFYNNEA